MNRLLLIPLVLFFSCEDKEELDTIPPTFVRGKVITASGDPVPDAMIKLVQSEFVSLNRTILDTNYFESANKLTFYNNVGDTAQLYFGIPITEVESLAFSLSPKPPAGAFDIRFSGDMSYTEYGGDIEIMNSSDSLIVEYNIINEIDIGHQWILNADDGTEFVLDSTGTLTFDGSVSDMVLYKVPQVPFEYSLGTNYPNPFNETTTINYQLAEEVYIKMWVTDFCEEDTITTLVDGVIVAGAHSVNWNGKNSHDNDILAGVYCIIMEVNDYKETIYSFLSDSENSLILSSTISNSDGEFYFNQTCIPFEEDAIRMGESPEDYLGSFTILRNVIVQATHPWYGTTIANENVLVHPNSGADITIQFE